MKVTLKILAAAMVVSLGFYNLKISKNSPTKYAFAIVENSASADSEAEEAGKYYQKNVTSGHSTDTITKPGGGTCSKSYDYVRISCIGTGTVKCTESYTKSNETTTC